MFKIDPRDMPDFKVTRDGNLRQSQPLTLANVAKILELAGVTLRMNMMSGRYEFHGPGIKPDLVSQTMTFHELEDTVTMLDMGGLTRLPEMLTNLSRKADAYHPMEDWMLSKKWDGKDRLAELAATVETDSTMWPVYLRKWLIQVVEAVSGWGDGVERSLPHVLVFVGGQGAGKGRWLRQLAPEACGRRPGDSRRSATRARCGSRCRAP